ncbi:MAG: FAD-dependent oxidoreductase [Deltaproteobacteria bacterium]|nr:FAD-dependent oxidoreductase [Deltaproteobacteria bacterium]
MSNRHAVAVIGGATAGAEVASRLAKSGAFVVVFDMNARPYGKIEDGLPRWHSALRKKEYENIKGKLDHPDILYVPSTKIGRDVSFEELTSRWGFTAVVLACGAWRDRPLQIEGADNYVGKGLIYQNPFVIAFNRSHYEKGVTPYEMRDDAIVVGGGLASIDVAKILMLETVVARLATRGVHVDIEELEHTGIPATLAQLGLTFEQLDLKGCTLFYRRRPDDMPLMEAPEGADAARLEKVQKSRRKILEKAMEKFAFKFEPLSVPEKLIVENGQLVGLGFSRVKVEGKKLVPTGETYERRGSYVISSIGSIPEAMPGVKMNGELFPFSDWDLGRIDAFPNVFSAGNVVTGKGNIIASRRHAEHVAEALVERFLGLGSDGHAGEEQMFQGVVKTAELKAEAIGQAVARLPKADAATVEQLRLRAEARKAEVGAVGTLIAWLDKVTPSRFT